QLTLFLAAVLIAGCAPLDPSSSSLHVLFINDFTLNFVTDDLLSNSMTSLPSSASKCPGNAYPTAAQQFDYTTAIVDAIDASIDLQLQYDF
ncbi:hypothetical protein PFISCL1PPCAC_26084, partial [Pristionchus fissidentatus]